MRKDLQVEMLSCPCTAARRVCRAVTQLYDLVLAPLRLKATQFIILRAIDEHGEIAQCELSREYTASVETLSRRLASMRKSGWIRLRVAEQRQEHVYSLTAEGESLLKQAMPVWQRANDRLAEAYEKGGAGDLAKVVSMLDELTKAAQLGLELRTSNHTGKRAANAA